MERFGLRPLNPTLAERFEVSASEHPTRPLNPTQTERLEVRAPEHPTRPLNPTRAERLEVRAPEHPTRPLNPTQAERLEVSALEHPTRLLNPTRAERLEVSAPEHPTLLQRRLHQQWLQGQNCDLVIRARSCHIPVHSAVVSCFSSKIGLHLLKAKTPGFASSGADRARHSLVDGGVHFSYGKVGLSRVDLDVDEEIVKTLVVFMYTGSLSVSWGHSLVLVQSAQQLGMKVLVDILQMYLERNPEFMKSYSQTGTVLPKQIALPGETSEEQRDISLGEDRSQDCWPVSDQGESCGESDDISEVICMDSVNLGVKPNKREVVSNYIHSLTHKSTGAEKTKMSEARKSGLSLHGQVRGMQELSAAKDEIEQEPWSDIPVHFETPRPKHKIKPQQINSVTRVENVSYVDILVAGYPKTNSIEKGGPPLSCQHCGKEFRHRQSCLRHEQRAHKKSCVKRLQIDNSVGDESTMAFHCHEGDDGHPEPLNFAEDNSAVNGVASEIINFKVEEVLSAVQAELSCGEKKQQEEGVASQQLHEVSSVCERADSAEAQHCQPKTVRKSRAHVPGCPLCHQQFDRSEMMSNHLRHDHPSNCFPCQQCPKVYLLSHNLTKHVLSFHVRRSWKCIHCSEVFTAITRFVAHNKNEHDDQKPFRCEVSGCQYGTDLLGTLKKHQRYRHASDSDKRKEICDKCGNGFPSKEYLHLHQLSCLKLEPHLCPTCGEVFSLKASLKQHINNKHGGKRRHSCAHCAQLFSCQANLRRHMRIHENVFPYICDTCGQKFRHTNSLKDHVRRKHGNG